MEQKFIDILKQIVKEQGNAAFADAKRCKALLADYTKNEYKKESRLIMIAVDAGMARAINDADDLEACKKTQIRDLDDDYALDTDVAEDIINTLALVLRGDMTRTVSPSAAAKKSEGSLDKKKAIENPARTGLQYTPQTPQPPKNTPPPQQKPQAPKKNTSLLNSGGPIFVIVDRDSGDGSSILLGIIGAAVGLGIGALIGGFIAIGLCGVIGWKAGSEIGKGVYVNLLAIILALVCGVLIAFLAGWTGNGLFPGWAPTIARILFLPFMIAAAALFIFARSRGNKILLITLVALSIGGAIALTEPPFPFSLSRNKAAAENAAVTQSADVPTPHSESAASSAADTAAVSSESAFSSDAQIAAYRIGGTGPAGGIVFYDKGGDSGGWRFLEAAPHDIQGTLRADADRPDVSGNMERAAGSGKTNSAALLREAADRDGGSGWAVQACDALVVNGYDDWFLPSRDELNYLYENLHKKGLGNFKDEIYWSSTFDSEAWEWSCIDFSNGRYHALPGAGQHRVRAVRQF